MNRLLNRHAAGVLQQLLEVSPVVALTGARQVGKSTLAQMVLRSRAGSYLTLDEIATRTMALADPQGFVSGRSGLTVIDEVQLAPALLSAIKLAVDRDRRPGQFLITGSANLLRMRSVTESLAGRSAWFDLPPLTWSEIRGCPAPATLDLAFSAEDAAGFVGRLPAATPGLAGQARERAIAGGMPATIHLNPAQRRAWYDGYRQTFLERDLRQLADIENLPEFNRLLGLAALRSGSLLNKAALAADAGLAHPTLRRYLNILEVAYQFFELPPFYANIGKRLVKTPKLYATDPGLCAHLANSWTWEEAMSMGLAGALLETWAVGEIRALDRLAERCSQICFYRTSTGREVDLVLERGSAVIGIELKASATVGPGDTAGLRELRDALGPRFRLGLVGYLGEATLALDRSLCLVPLGVLLGAVSGP